MPCKAYLRFGPGHESCSSCVFVRLGCSRRAAELSQPLERKPVGRSRTAANASVIRGSRIA